MMQKADVIRDLPIDISFTRFGEWLVDRKKVPSDWRKRLSAVKARISMACTTLPKDIEPYFRNLDPEDIGYVEAKLVCDILRSSSSESRNIFGRLSGAAGIWESIVHSYEKDYLFLGEAAQTMVQNVNYEIPYLKKQTQKIQQQLAELDRREIDIKRAAALSASKYAEACRELGLQGKDVRTELVETAKSLSKAFSNILEVLNGVSVSQALEYYSNVIKDIHTEKDKNAKDSLVNLRALRESPPSLNISPLPEILGVRNISTDVESTHESGNVHAVDEIDWDISADTSQIDWGIGAIDGIAENGNGFDLGKSMDYEISSLDDIVSNEKIDIQSRDNLALKMPCGMDITAMDMSCGSMQTDLKKHTCTQDDETRLSTASERSELLEVDYRNKLLDDLYEIKAFLNQRLIELRSGETMSLQHQLQAVAPPVLQQYSTEAIETMLSDVISAVSLLTCQKTRDLIMILNSKRFLDRMVGLLEEKKNHEAKLKEGLKDLASKRMELQNLLSSSWPKQESFLKQTRELKKLCESTISAMFDRRPVNLIGEISTVLNRGISG